MPDFKLPDLGEGVTEAEIDKWLVAEGDSIEEDAPLVEVITDKATAEIPSPFAGIVAKIHIPEGSTVPVGTVLVTVLRGSDLERAPTMPARRPPAPPRPRAPDAEPTGAEPAAVRTAVTSAPPSRPDGQVRAMPPVRKLARDLGVDLSTVTGTGPSGRILREDVQAAATAPREPSVTSDTTWERADTSTEPVTDGPEPSDATWAKVAPESDERREPLRGVRKKIAERMSAAHQIIPPVTHVEECDVTELDATRRLANERAPDRPRLTFMPFIVKAVVSALKDHPAVNASLDDEAGEIVYHAHYNIGVAVDTPAGLTVVVVRDADRKNLRAIATEIDRMAMEAREGRISAADLGGATFTISSPGPYGGLLATPIVFHPQSAILGVHRATDRPVVRDGQIVIRKVMNLSITFDHRILDGMTAAKWVLEVANLLEHPAVLAL
jgi:pyruvate dehydrogenase E2 component (dihydrolipoamide acetyltransferase)